MEHAYVLCQHAIIPGGAERGTCTWAARDLDVRLIFVIGVTNTWGVACETAGFAGSTWGAG